MSAAAEDLSFRTDMFSNRPKAAPDPTPVLPYSPPDKKSPWIVGPWFDLLFFANLTWPIFAIAMMAGLIWSYQLNAASPIYVGINFWFIFMLATPHRWITLGLVFLDRDRFTQRSTAYLGVFLFFLAVTISMVSLNLVVLLLILDWMWNAWHFAAQHSGIGRIYGRIVYPQNKSSGLLEKILLRTFVLYVIIRLAGAPVMGLDRQKYLSWLDFAVTHYFNYIDYPMFLLPVILLAMEIPKLKGETLSRFIYLCSVCLLYSGVLLAYHLDGAQKIVLSGLVLAIGVFHSTEYLAIVSWSVKKRFGTNKKGLFGFLAPRWGIALGIFMFALGFGAWAINNHYERFWLVVTAMVSYLHYAYDGMIWKVRRPASAAVA